MGTIPLSAGDITLSSESYSPSTATASLTLFNAAPQASDDSTATSEDTPVTVDVLANDTDVDIGDALTIDSVTQGANGSVVIDNTQVIYTPNPDFCGTDSFVYTLSDLYGGTAEATVTVAVTCVNDAPTVAEPIGDVTVDEDAPATLLDLSSTFTDVDINTNSDSLDLSVVNDNHALLTALLSRSTLVLDYAADQNGTANLTVRATDLAGAYVEDSFLVTVNAVDDAPVAADDNASTLEDTPVTVDAAANDTDVDGDLDPATATVVTPPALGIVENRGDGTFIYTPALDVNGLDSFIYEICDTAGLCDQAVVSITIAPVNDPPDCSSAVASNGFIWSPDKTLWEETVFGVTDPDGDQVTITVVSIFQDEPVGTGQHCPDGFGVGTDTAEVRAERDPKGDGRVYHIGFEAKDGWGGLCSGDVRVGAVPHDQGGEPDIDAMDGGAIYDSTQCD
jgi:hypothetical protein